MWMSGRTKASPRPLAVFGPGSTCRCNTCQQTGVCWGCSSLALLSPLPRPTLPCTCAGLLLGIEERAQRAEYRQLLADCQAAYCAARLALVADVTRARIAALARKPLPALTRSGCAYLMQVRLPVLPQGGSLRAELLETLSHARRPLWSTLDGAFRSGWEQAQPKTGMHVT